MNKRVLVTYATKYGATAEIAEKVGEVQPHEIVVFHGALEVEALNFIEKRMIKMVEAPTGDFRDWQGIIAWATAVAETLKETVA